MHRPGKLFSIFFLSLLLISLIQTGFHAFAHADPHCNDFSERHFHEEQDHCCICDFTFSIQDCLSDVNIDFSDVLNKQDYQQHRDVQYILSPDYFFRLKAPPLN